MSNDTELDCVVMFVDDDSDILDQYRDNAEDLGYQCILASSGEQALEMVNKSEIFLIATDIRMPVMDGIELCRKLREVNSSVPIVGISGFSDRENALGCLRSGAQDLLEKPLTFDKLTDLLRKYYDEYSQRKTAELEEELALKSIFIEEAQDLLAEVDAPILSLESVPVDILEINNLYRTIHTVKGSAASVKGTKKVCDVAHIFETILSKMKQEQLSPSPEIIDTMLTAADTLRSLVDAIEKNAEELPSVENILERLNNCLTGATNSQTTAPAAAAKSRPAPASRENSDDGINVSNDKLDSFMSMVGELVAFKNIFQGFISAGHFENALVKLQVAELEKMLTKITDQIQNRMMEVRRVSVGKTFSKFPRIVRQIASDTNKKISLEITGQDIEVDKTISKALGASLVHLIRNACDHGIEGPEDRSANGKHESGSISIHAEESQGSTVITINDDGRGLNKEKILKQAIEKNLVDSDTAENLSNEEIYKMIFLPGFSTAEKITEVSGRGVGMDVVKTSIEGVNGVFHITSTPGAGTQIVLEIPVPTTVMVEQSIVAMSGEVSLVIPLSSIFDIQRCDVDRIMKIQEGWSMEFRDEMIPIGNYQNLILYGQEVTISDKSEFEDKLLVAVNCDGQRIGLLVDSISEQVQAVVRPFDPVISGMSGFKGVTILSDETVAFVLSAEDFVRVVLEKINSEQLVA